MENRRNCSLGAISPLFYNIFHLLLGFHVYAGTRFSLRDKRLFEISEVEITRVNCTSLIYSHFVQTHLHCRSTTIYKDHKGPANIYTMVKYGDNILRPRHSLFVLRFYSPVNPMWSC